MWGDVRIQPDRVYQDYINLDPGSYPMRIRFFEHHESLFRRLEFERFFDVYFDYINALFEIGAYDRYLERVDWLIVKIIAHNIYIYKGKDVFTDQVFRKAAALFHTGAVEESLGICREVLAMDSGHKAANYLVYNCMRSVHHRFWMRLRSLGALFLILSALLLFFELIYIRNYRPESVDWFVWIPRLVGLGAVGLVVSAEYYLRFKAYLFMRRVKRKDCS